VSLLSEKWRKARNISTQNSKIILFADKTRLLRKRSIGFNPFPQSTKKEGSNRQSGQSHQSKGRQDMSVIEQIAENLMKGKANDVKALVEKALGEGAAPAKILNEGLLKGMGIIGERFKKNEVYVPEVLIAARAMKAGMSVLQPKLVAAGVQAIGVAVIGTVKGDLHDIGKNLVGMMLEGAGLKVIDMGIDVPAEKFLAGAKENKAQIIGVSALLTTTMTNMKSVVDAVKASDVKGKVKVMIGGAPVTQAFCDEIGADGYAPDAASAADLAKSLLKKCC
jgi:5-methyltetrahydrofolate--homocysteine methyltransferase